MGSLKEEFDAMQVSERALVEYLQDATLDGLGMMAEPESSQCWLSGGFWNNLGYPIPSTEDVAWHTLILPEDWEIWTGLFSHLAESPDNSANAVLRFIRKDQELRYFRVRAAQLSNKRIVLVFTDVSEEKQAAANLARQKNYLEQILMNTGDMVFVLDNRLRFVDHFHSDSEKDQLVRRNDFLGKSIAEIGFPEKALQAIEHALKRALSTGQRQKTEYELRLPHGKQWFSAVITLKSDPENGADTLICVVRNISDRVERESLLKDSARRFELFFNNSMAGFFFMMLDEPIYWNEGTDKEATLDYVFTHQRITRVNQAMLDQYRAREENFIGLTPADFFAHDPLHGREIWREFFDSGRALMQTNERRMDGSLMWVEGDYICTYDELGRITGHFGVQKDITERKEAEQKLEEARIEAERANRARGEFLAHISHEIRTPLNGVIGFTDLLSQIDLPGAGNQYAALAQQSASLLLGIVNNVLDFSKIDAGKMKLDLEPTDITRIARESMDAVVYQGHKKGLELVLDIDPSIPSAVLADSLHLRQVLVNLLGNAVKFCESGEVVLSINSGIREGNFRFAVRDTGPGIDELQMDRIFEAFSQGQRQGQRMAGTGLGLTISSELVKLMGGLLKVESARGIGSTFYFDLDLEIQDSSSPYSRPESLERCLIAARHPAQRKTMDRLLRSWGAECVHAASLSELTEAVKGGPFDLVLIDDELNSEVLTAVLDDKDSARVVVLERLNESTFPDNLTDSSVVRLTRPVDARSLSRALSGLPTKSAKSALEKLSGKARILVADDNIVNRTLTRHIIANLMPGAEIIEASNGREVLNLLSARPVDLIFMDVQMEPMNGLETTLEIRRSKQKQPIIIGLTASNMNNERDKSLASGMDGFLEKPAVREDFLRVLRTLVDSRKSSRPEPSRNVFNESRFLLQTGLDSASVSALLDAARKNLRDNMRSLKQAASSGDAAEFARTLHIMKGTALSMCLEELAEALENAETALGANKPPVEVLSLVLGPSRNLGLCQNREECPTL